MKKLTLGETQRRFTKMVGSLIFMIYARGYEGTLGDAYRDPRVHGPFGSKGGYGAAHSQHKRRLAIDINLFKDGKYLDKTEDHAVFGEFWESVGGTWGGRWGDGNHYSLEYEGYK